LSCTGSPACSTSTRSSRSPERTGRPGERPQLPRRLTPGPVPQPA
jgi:hypothetical protein